MSTEAATRAAAVANRRRRAERLARELAELSPPFVRDHATTAYLAALVAQAPPLSDEQVSLLRRLLPPVPVAEPRPLAGVPGPTRARPGR